MQTTTIDYPLQRELFEKWAREQGFHTSKDIHHSFEKSKINWMWKAWQAAIASAPVVIVDITDMLGICAPDEELFEALYALRGKRRVRLVLDEL